MKKEIEELTALDWAYVRLLRADVRSNNLTQQDTMNHMHQAVTTYSMPAFDHMCTALYRESVAEKEKAAIEARRIAIHELQHKLLLLETQKKVLDAEASDTRAHLAKLQGELE